MHDKDPTAYGLITYLWVTGLAAWGGLVSFYRRVKAGESSFANLFELIGELATSAFAGLITFWLCEAAQFKPLITAALVGISGHMGSRAIFQLERWAQARFGHRDHDGDGKNG
ncbi:MAG: phage holin family protein [Rhodocyclaceae bacterium]|jgi:hypothetical protein|nr:phage holin family protein [Rhodocyclaceae bacterium]